MIKNIDYSFITHSKGQNFEKGNTFIHHNNLFFIIDGVGRDYLRAKATGSAYSVILETFLRVFEKNNSPGDAIFSSLKQANRFLLEERIKIDEKMAASVCILYIENRIMYFSHLGDSRIYSFQDNELNQLTRDHTLREEDPFAEKRYDDPRALQALIKGLGINESPEVYIKKYPLEKKGIVILTTERLTERISNRDLLWLSKKVNNPKKLVKNIAELYGRKGGDEGFTLGIIRYGVYPTWLRKLISIYLVFFLLIIAVAGGYFLWYGGSNSHGGAEGITGPVMVEGHKVRPALIDQKSAVPLEPVEKTVVRQPIFADNGWSATDKTSDRVETAAAENTKNEFHSFINEWKSAWERSAGVGGDIAEYISFYSKEFRAGRLDKGGWTSDKSRKNRRKKWIRVEISGVKISDPDKNKRVRVTFSQDYRSSNFSVVSIKELILRKEGDEWFIVSEKSS